MFKGQKLLEHAIGIVKEREQQYGPILPLVTDLSERWSITLNHKITPEDALLCLIDLKLTRLKKNKGHMDSLLDIAGYVACFAELLEEDVQ